MNLTCAAALDLPLRPVPFAIFLTRNKLFREIENHASDTINNSWLEKEVDLFLKITQIRKC